MERAGEMPQEEISEEEIAAIHLYTDEEIAAMDPHGMETYFARHTRTREDAIELARARRQINAALDRYYASHPDEDHRKDHGQV